MQVDRRQFEPTFRKERHFDRRLFDFNKENKESDESDEELGQEIRRHSDHQEIERHFDEELKRLSDQDDASDEDLATTFRFRVRINKESVILKEPEEEFKVRRTSRLERLDDDSNDDDNSEKAPEEEVKVRRTSRLERLDDDDNSNDLDFVYYDNSIVSADNAMKNPTFIDTSTDLDDSNRLDEDNAVSKTVFRTTAINSHESVKRKRISSHASISIFLSLQFKHF